MLPVMTHLLALQQTPGRIRFIIRGKWLDESPRRKSSLKLLPGDVDSIEAKWVKLDEVRCLQKAKLPIFNRKVEKSMDARTRANHLF
jgi:hypothetical protein